jgi:hypothetical protein
VAEIGWKLAPIPGRIFSHASRPCRRFDAAHATLDLTQQSYQAGQASLLQRPESQRLYQQARLGLARANGQRHTDTAQLFIAMGGAQPEPKAHTGSLPAPVAREVGVAAND